MGVVWLAEDARLGRKVALKFLPPDAATDPSRRQRFEQEARAAAVLSHPGIATVHELGECDGQMYIVFERVQGVTLRMLLTGRGLARNEVLDIAVDVAEAMAAAHVAGVVHRDLKPENVMRTPDGECKVLDFGLARVTAAAQSLDSLTRSNLTAAGTLVGTVGYMAPEQLEGKDVDFRADIFSFGTLLYELATGAHPFSGDSAASTIAAIMTADPPPLTQRNQLQPAELERIVRKCLRKRRDERYQSTRDLAVDLRNLRRELSSGAQAAQPASPSLPVENRPLISAKAGRRWWWLHQLGTMFGTTSVIIYLLWRAHAFVPAPWKLTMSMAATFILALHWSVRFALVNAALGNPADLAARIRRVSQWIQWTGWPVVALLGVTTVIVAPGSEFLAIPMAALTSGGVVCLVFLDPFVERAGFPTAELSLEKAKQDKVRTWWWMHLSGTLSIGFPGTLYLAWLAGSTLNRPWANAIMIGVIVTILFYACLRSMLIFFFVFIPDEVARQAHRTGLAERVLSAAAFAGLLALAAALFGTHVGLAVGLVVWSAACLMASQVIAPAIDRIVFPR